MQNERRSRMKIGIFFSHPTQHHSILFRHLSQVPELDVKVFYYDPGSLGKMFDPGLGVAIPWDIDLLSGTNSTVLFNILRGRRTSVFRQLNPKVISILLNERFDAIFLLGYVSFSNWLVLAMAKLTGAHVLYQSDTNIVDQAQKKTSWIKQVLRTLFLRNVNTILVIGNKNKDALLAFGADDKKMVWCPIPVDMERYQAARSDPNLEIKLDELRRKYTIPKHAHVIAFCGKLIPRKRPEDIIAALRKLEREDVYGLLIGAGELEPSLLESLNSNDNIRITGFVNQSLIPYHMLLADIAVVPSERDPHPIVTTEFASFGLPLIVSDRTGVWGENDILRPNENGFVFPCGDISVLASHIEHLVNDSDLRERMGRRSSDLAKQQSVTFATEIMTQLFRSLPRHMDAVK